LLKAVPGERLPTGVDAIIERTEKTVGLMRDMIKLTPRKKQN